MGAAICRQLSQAGHSVAFTYCRNTAQATELAHELKAPFYALDLHATDFIPPVIQSLSEKLGGLDALVVAAGVATAHQKEGVSSVPKWDEIEAAAFTQMLSVNVLGSFFACQTAGALMKPHKRGRMVLIGSIDGVKSVPSPADYAGCKAALVGMVQSLSKDLGSHGILVNLIAPGILNGPVSQ